MKDSRPEEFAALIVPGGNVTALAENLAFRDFLSKASRRGARIAAFSQAASLVPGALVASTTDDVPQCMRTLLKEFAR
jgi:putative intracellular protease/amidase